MGVHREHADLMKAAREFSLSHWKGTNMKNQHRPPSWTYRKIGIASVENKLGFIAPARDLAVEARASAGVASAAVAAVRINSVWRSMFTRPLKPKGEVRPDDGEGGNSALGCAVGADSRASRSNGKCSRLSRKPS